MLDYNEIVSDFCTQQQLNITLSTDMPEGYESAYGTFDIVKNTLFINHDLLNAAPDFEVLFYLFHELRHAVQYTRPHSFSKAIQQSLAYVLCYDGTCFQLVNGAWLECKLEGPEQFLVNAYLGQPYELDANRFAYEAVQKQCGASAELDKLYSLWLPKETLSEEIYLQIYSEIDRRLK